MLQILPDESFTNELKQPLVEIKSMEALDYWLRKFIFEVRKRDESRYPRDSLDIHVTDIFANLNANIKDAIGPVNLFKDT